MFLTDIDATFDRDRSQGVLFNIDFHITFFVYKSRALGKGVP
jgi:hypothetical protein